MPRTVAPRGVYHVVKHGQTLWSIARAYGVDLKTLERANHLTNAHILRIGQKLYMPGATKRREVVRRCPCRPPTPALSRHRPPLLPPKSISPPRSPSIAQNSARLRRPSRLFWPLQGTITRSFRRSGKRRHDGLDIAARQGTPIRAAADGKVLFSAWGPGGYGRIVILRHATGLVTVYAHNHRNLVRAGQHVRQGDRIATVGRSGRATGFHLHFEVRRKTVPVSPLIYLSSNRHVARLKRR